MFKDMQINIIKEKSVDKRVNIQCTDLEIHIICRLKAYERYDTFESKQDWSKQTILLLELVLFGSSYKWSKVFGSAWNWSSIL